MKKSRDEERVGFRTLACLATIAEKGCGAPSELVDVLLTVRS
jgi:hypothetical protein